MDYKEWLNKRADELREHPTGVEWIIEGYLKKRKIKHKFQVPIIISENKGYIADFVFFNRVIMEVDGTIHKTPEMKKRDLIKEMDLNKKGYRVVRVTNADILKSNGTAIKETLEKISPYTAKTVWFKQHKKRMN